MYLNSRNRFTTEDGAGAPVFNQGLSGIF